MNKNIIKRVVNLSEKMIDLPVSRNKHFSFILDKNKIVSIGYNNGWHTHPRSKELEYRFDAMHSELSAILKYKGRKRDFKQFTLINTRMNSLGQLCMAKPCPMCRQLIESLGFKKVYFSNRSGEFERFV